MSERVRISGKKCELPEVAAEDWKWDARPGGVWIGERTLADGQVERRRVVAVAWGNRVALSLGGANWTLERSGGLDSMTGAGAAGGDSDFTAKFPGKVRKIMVASGASVNEGDPLILLEAMKMEFSIKAPSAGRVRKILVEAGQQISPGTLLLEFESDDD